MLKKTGMTHTKRDKDEHRALINSAATRILFPNLPNAQIAYLSRLNHISNPKLTSNAMCHNLGPEYICGYDYLQVQAHIAFVQSEKDFLSSCHMRKTN